MVRAQRDFLARAVRYLVRDAGVRQFLDVGTGIPSVGNVQEVAQEIAPEARVVYVDNDPIVLAHALMTSTPEGRTAFVPADVRSPESVLGDPVLAATLDLGQPVALMLPPARAAGRSRDELGEGDHGEHGADDRAHPPQDRGP